MPQEKNRGIQPPPAAGLPEGQEEIAEKGDKKAPEKEPLSAEERRALLALDDKAASEALEKEDPLALALATEFIILYSEKAGEELRQGRDYLPLLAPASGTPALERIAMEIVLDSLEEELEDEY